MLVVVRVDVGGDSRSVWIWFVICADVDLENAGETDLDFNGSVLVEEVIPDILCNDCQETEVCSDRK